MILPDELQRVAEAMARAEDETLGALVRRLLAKEISRRQNARPPDRADELLVAPLRARLTGDLADARNWEDLRRRLAGKGFALREAGGGLALHRHPTGERLCKASDLGFSYSRLMRRFRAPFPGHRHTHLEQRYLAAAAPATMGGDDDDPVLIEPF
ncbi:hypothetical protein [Pseudoroseicyclus tamaricis]|uniref:hypothetical protein n=1 Tax=Pseudoroseicyclus tamaricis TaxID=2705421 RepID=UPI00193EFF10|nr:hypothetical protein [Pseudoroseicyclus tamaricis]